MVEQESRRAELAMYVLPKAAESLYKILYQKNWIKGVKHWEVMMFSFAMSLIMVRPMLFFLCVFEPYIRLKFCKRVRF